MQLHRCLRYSRYSFYSRYSRYRPGVQLHRCLDRGVYLDSRARLHARGRVFSNALGASKTKTTALRSTVDVGGWCALGRCVCGGRAVNIVQFGTSPFGSPEPRWRRSRSAFRSRAGLYAISAFDKHTRPRGFTITIVNHFIESTIADVPTGRQHNRGEARQCVQNVFFINGGKYTGVL